MGSGKIGRSADRYGRPSSLWRDKKQWIISPLHRDCRQLLGTPRRKLVGTRWQGGFWVVEWNASLVERYTYRHHGKCKRSIQDVKLGSISLCIFGHHRQYAITLRHFCYTNWYYVQVDEWWNKGLLLTCGLIHPRHMGNEVECFVQLHFISAKIKLLILIHKMGKPEGKKYYHYDCPWSVIPYNHNPGSLSTAVTCRTRVAQNRAQIAGPGDVSIGNMTLTPSHFDYGPNMASVTIKLKPPKSLFFPRPFFQYFTSTHRSIHWGCGMENLLEKHHLDCGFFGFFSQN